MADSDDQTPSWTTRMKTAIAGAFKPVAEAADDNIQARKDSGQPNQFQADMKLPLKERLKRVQKGFTGEGQ